MKVLWRKSALDSLLELDKWRESIELEPIAEALKSNVEQYFYQNDFSVYIPGRKVLIKRIAVNLRMVLIAIGSSDPYKVFYRLSESNLEIYLIRHPLQKTL